MTRDADSRIDAAGAHAARMPDAAGADATQAPDATATDAIDLLRSQWSAKRPELDTSPAATIGRLLRIAKHVTALSDARLAEFGIGRGEFDVLSVVRRAEQAPTPSALAQALLAANASITKRLVLLEKSGLATRTRSSSDGRVVTVSLTEAGADLIDRALPAQLSVEAALVGVLSEPDRHRFELTLRRLLLECEPPGA